MKRVVIYVTVLLFSYAAAQLPNCQRYTFDYYSVNFDQVFEREGVQAGLSRDCFTSDEVLTFVYLASIPSSKRMGEELLKEFLGSQTTLSGNTNMDGWTVSGVLDNGESATVAAGTFEYLARLRGTSPERLAELLNNQNYPIILEHDMTRDR